MTKEEFKEIVRYLRSLYTDPKFIPDKYAFEAWYSVLGDLDARTASIAVVEVARTLERGAFPQPGMIWQTAMKNITVPQMPFDEAWDLLLHAIQRGIYHAEEEFSKLPEIIQKTIVSPDWIREAAMEDKDDLQNVRKSLFRRSYEAMQKRERDKAMLGDDLRKAIEEDRIDQMDRRALEREEERERLEGLIGGSGDRLIPQDNRVYDA